MHLDDPETQLFDFDAASADDQLLSIELNRALTAHFGLPGFRAGQQRVIERVMQGRSTLALMPTGAGKSLCYQLPALLLPHATVVISPLIALMKDQIDGLPPAVREQSTLINSSLEWSEIRQRLRDLAAGRYKMVYVAPERLRQRQFLAALQNVGISLFVVDEAHCVSLWGLSFRPDYLFIREALQTLGNPPTLALTATASPITEREILQHLGDLEVVRTNVFRPNLQLEVIRAANHSVRQAVAEELCATIDGSIIVYVRSRAGCERLAERLRQLGIEAEAYHAQCPDRDAIQDRFMRGETRVIAATIAFGMGVDKPDVRAVIHMNLPKSLDDYAQEAGRAGRDGLPARCILLYTSSDKGQLTTWMQEEAFTLEELRDLYRVLLQQLGQQQNLVALEVLAQHSGLEDTRLRVALGMLERTELLRRHFDAPRVVRLARGQAPLNDPQALAFCSQLELTTRIQEWSLYDLAPVLNLPLSAIEAQLLAWHQAGWIEYDGVARELLLELLPAPQDTPQRIQRLLQEYRSAQNQRIDAIGDYARHTKRCRHRMLAAHFGQRLQPCGDACDICARGRAVEAPPLNQPHTLPLTPAASTWGIQPLLDHHRIIIEAVRSHPGTLSSRDLAHILTGSRGYGDHPLYGALGNRSFDSVRAEIDVLVEAGQLAYRGATLIATADQASTIDSEPVLTVLRSLTRLPFGLGRTGLARLLKGASSAAVGPQRSPDHGALSQLAINTIEDIIEALVTAGLVARDERDRMRLLHITPVGEAALEQPEQLPTLHVKPTSTLTQAAQQPDLQLLERLKEWRASEAEAISKPRYIIFPDSVLWDIAVFQPTTHAELSAIKGVGPQKLAQWGDAVLQIIVSEHTATASISSEH